MAINDKIAKLLALAGNNPNEAEAKAAILKAHELMAEYKLRPEDCEIVRKEKVIKSEVGVTCSARLYAWGCNLSAIIAEHYCCIAYRNHAKYRQEQRIGFIGLESDFEICSRIFRYAFDCVKSTSDEIFNTDKDIYPGDVRRKAAEAYGWGFCAGLSQALKAQNEKHQEWGLVMVVPQAVKDAQNGMKHSSYGRARVDSYTERAATARGYADGCKFDPASKLSEADAPLALA